MGRISRASAARKTVSGELLSPEMHSSNRDMILNKEIFDPYMGIINV